MKGDTLEVYDFFNPMRQLENVFTTQPFRSSEPDAKASKPGVFTHIFRVKAPLLKPDEVLCILGHGKVLRNWDTAAPVLMKKTGAWWEARLDFTQEEFPLGYKYGVWNARSNQFLGFETGGNRPLYAVQSSVASKSQPVTLLHDNFARLPLPGWSTRRRSHGSCSRS